MKPINTVIFDLGGVLINWEPRYVYKNVFDSQEKLDWFFENVCTLDWNEQQDAGYPIAKAVEEKIAEFPEWEKEIRIYYDRWTEMLRGPIDGTVEIFRQLKTNTDLKFYALTNWSAELFPIALERYDFLHWFDGRVVSGEEMTRKPFADIYLKLLDRYKVDAAEAIFIDDNFRNIKAAEELGIPSIHFQSPEQLRESLIRQQLL
jgi:2-haloacid dehalogenase